MTQIVLAAPPVSVPTDPTNYVIMGGASVLIVYVMMRLTKKRKKDPFDTPFQTRGLAQQRSTERHFETLLVELSEMSRQISAQLDTRAAKLEIVIKDADERIARLEALNAQAPPRSFTMPAEATIVAPEPARRQPPPEPAAEAPPASAPPPPVSEYADVYRMADEGRAVPAIAAELRRPSGEIELILALRPRG